MWNPRSASRHGGAGKAATDRASSRPTEGCTYFASCPTGVPPAIPSAKKLPQCVVYVGDAKDLNKRPLTGTHHRIKRYQELFDQELKSLFVSFAPIYQTGCQDSHVQRAFAFFAEAMLVWEYTKRHGHPPAMHYKDKGNAPDWADLVVTTLRKNA